MSKSYRVSGAAHSMDTDSFSRFDITEYWMEGHEGREVQHDPADRYVFSADKYIAKQCGGALLSVPWASPEFEYLEGTCNALLPLLRAQCPQRWQPWLDSNVVTLELRLNCGQDKESTASLYAIELHVRIGHLDTLDEEEELPWPVDIDLQPGTQGSFTEHWLRIKRGKRVGKVFVKKYHTRCRSSGFEPSMMREVYYEYGFQDLDADIAHPQWKAVFDMPKWTKTVLARASTTGSSSLPPRETAPSVPQLDGDFMIKETTLRVIPQDCKIYMPVKPDGMYEEVANFVFKYCINVLQWDQNNTPHSAAELMVHTIVNGNLKAFTVTLDTDCLNTAASLDACIKNQSSYYLSCRKLPIQMLAELINPLIAECESKHARTKAVTMLGLQVRHIKELRTNNAQPVFLYENCVFHVHNGYDSLRTLEEGGYRLVTKVFQDTTKSMLGNGGFPRLAIVNSAHDRRLILECYIRLTTDFHGTNAPAALWAQGLVWASLSFLEWIEIDKCFPIAYLMSSLHGNGKSTTMYALAESIGLPQEAIGGNKTSESGFLDWVNSCNGLPYFLDDFNAKAANLSKDQHTFKELFKSLHDANSVCQHDKFRLVLSASVVSSNTQLAPWDAPTQSRLMTFIFENSTKCPLSVVKNYNNLMKTLSCLVPDILSWRYNGRLDIDCINELQAFIQEYMQPLSLQPRIAQHLKKPMYYLCLALIYVNAPVHSFDTYVFKYLKVQLMFYYHHCTQTDMWSKFFKFMSKAISVCNIRSSDGRTFIHW